MISIKINFFQSNLGTNNRVNNDVWSNFYFPTSNWEFLCDVNIEEPETVIEVPSNFQLKRWPSVSEYRNQSQNHVDFSEELVNVLDIGLHRHFWSTVF